VKNVKSYIVGVYQNRDEFADMMTDGTYHDDWLDPNADENVREYSFDSEPEAREFMKTILEKLLRLGGVENYATSLYAVGPRGGRKILY